MKLSESQRLQLDDLLQPLGESSTSLQPLLQATKAIRSGAGRTGALSAPVPLRTKDRLDRDAAYQETKQSTEKWQATMKHIKEVCNC
jgi:U3 small nucleolar RNA-associated protein 14